MAKGTEAATLFIFVLAVTGVAATAGQEPDPKGYVTFCPCMGKHRALSSNFFFLFIYYLLNLSI